jgi:Ni,Fe-hydrogenase III large subunit
MSTGALLQALETVPSRPWPRHVLTAQQWVEVTRSAAADGWLLLGHWAETFSAHALFLDPTTMTVHPLTVAVENGAYPALSPEFPGAAWYERMVHDLWGHQATDGIDRRRWLDHGAWPQSRPLSTRPLAAEGYAPEAGDAEIDLVTESPLLPLGPLWGDRDEPSSLALTLDGPAIAQAECRLGYAHKGILSLMRGKSPRAAARFAARISGDSTVAHASAFAQASEAALEVAPPPRAAVLRIVMAELERIAGHLDTLSAVAGLVDAGRVQMQCGALREVIARATSAAFGHRLMMDCVVPGGVAADLPPAGAEAILRALGELSGRLPSIRRAFDGGVMAAHLAGVGHADATTATALAVGGIVGRACGRAFDVRASLSPAYAAFTPRLATRPDGDAAACQQLRIFEIEESIRLIGVVLAGLPAGAVAVPLPLTSGEGIACAESIRGDVWHWLRLDHGQIAAAFVRDPGWALWPFAERVLETALATEAPLIRLAFALPASGMDL